MQLSVLVRCQSTRQLEIHAMLCRKLPATYSLLSYPDQRLQPRTSRPTLFAVGTDETDSNVSGLAKFLPTILAIDLPRQMPRVFRSPGHTQQQPQRSRQCPQ